MTLATGNVGLADQRKATSIVRLTSARLANLELVPPLAQLSSQIPTVQLTARARYSDGTILDASDLVRLTLATDSGDAVSLRPSGLVTGLNAGSTTILASYRGETGQSTVSVSDPPLPRTISVTPVDGSGREDTEVRFQALGSLEGGRIIDLTDRVVWNSENEGVVSFDRLRRGLGLVRGQGKAVVMANDKVSGVTARMAFHGVSRTPPDGLRVDPGQVKLTGPSQSRNLTVNARYPEGLEIPVREGISWSSSHPDVKVSPLGKVSVAGNAKESTTATVTATVATEVDGVEVPVEAGSSSHSYSFSAADGYEVAEYRQAANDAEGREHSSTLDIVTDPDGKVPVKGRVETIEPSPTGTGSDVVRSKIDIDNLGEVLIDGQPAGKFEGLGEGGVPLEDYLQDPSISGAALLQGIYKVSKGATGVPGNVAKYLTNKKFSGAGTSYGKLASSVDIFGFAYGIEEAISGAVTGDWKRSLTGVGFTAGGTNALASALGALPEGALSGKAGALAKATAGTKLLGKGLGAVGGVVTFGFGVHSLWTDTGSQRTAGALNTAAGAIAIGSAFFGPPGWIVGGLVSGTLGLIALGIGNNDAEREARETAPLWFEE